LLGAFSRRKPWKPFTLELVSGSRVEVNHPESLTQLPIRLRERGVCGKGPEE
jgi:hypothetical protein